MAASKAAEMVDPTVQGQYPVVLSDALLGEGSKHVYTGIRYNHKPALSSDAAPSAARLKPSNGTVGEFDLSYMDGGDKYAYAGTRAVPAKDGGQQQFALVFDPARQVFVLHRLDSLFSMNLTRTPTNSDPESLRAAHPHLPLLPAEGRKPDTTATATKVKDKPAAGKTSAAASKPSAAVKKKAEKEVPPPLPLPPPPAEPAAAKVPDKGKKKKKPVEEEEDDDDSDDDGGLVMVFPEGRVRNDFSPAFPTPAPRLITTSFDEFAARGGDDEDADADADAEDEGIFDPAAWDPEEDERRMGELKLPSPVNHPPPVQAAPPEDDLDDLMEAELEKEFMDSESSVSEED